MYIEPSQVYRIILDLAEANDAATQIVLIVL